MQSKEANYFTAGELAAIFSISKQTLLYYDKIGLLSPEFVSENGYRHYSISQYLILEIIVNLRNLNISISNIKEYINARNKNMLIKILEEKERECGYIITENERIRNSIAKIKSSITLDYKEQLNKITLSYQPSCKFSMSTLKASSSGKERIISYIQHSHKRFHLKGVVEEKLGWIVSKENFFNLPQNYAAKAYFSNCPDVEGHTKTPKFILPAGFYITIYFSGTFYQNSENLSKQLSDFLKMNKLIPVSDIFILPIENHWLTNNSKNYITKIFLQVQYQ